MGNSPLSPNTGGKSGQRCDTGKDVDGNSDNLSWPHNIIRAEFDKVKAYPGEESWGGATTRSDQFRRMCDAGKPWTPNINPVEVVNDVAETSTLSSIEQISFEPDKKIDANVDDLKETTELTRKRSFIKPWPTVIEFQQLTEQQLKGALPKTASTSDNCGCFTPIPSTVHKHRSHSLDSKRTPSLSSDKPYSEFPMYSSKYKNSVTIEEMRQHFKAVRESVSVLPNRPLMRKNLPGLGKPFSAIGPTKKPPPKKDVETWPAMESLGVVHNYLPEIKRQASMGDGNDLKDNTNKSDVAKMQTKALEYANENLEKSDSFSLVSDIKESNDTQLKLEVAQKNLPNLRKTNYDPYDETTFTDTYERSKSRFPPIFSEDETTYFEEMPSSSTDYLKINERQRNMEKPREESVRNNDSPEAPKVVKYVSKLLEPYTIPGVAPNIAKETLPGLCKPFEDLKKFGKIKEKGALPKLLQDLRDLAEESCDIGSSQASSETSMVFADKEKSGERVKVEPKDELCDKWPVMDCRTAPLADDLKQGKRKSRLKQESKRELVQRSSEKLVSLYKNTVQNDRSSLKDIPVPMGLLREEKLKSPAARSRPPSRRRVASPENNMTSCDVSESSIWPATESLPEVAEPKPRVETRESQQENQEMDHFADKYIENLLDSPENQNRAERSKWPAIADFYGRKKRLEQIEKEDDEDMEVNFSFEDCNREQPGSREGRRVPGHSGPYRPFKHMNLKKHQ